MVIESTNDSGKRLPNSNTPTFTEATLVYSVWNWLLKGGEIKFTFQ